MSQSMTDLLLLHEVLQTAGLMGSGMPLKTHVLMLPRIRRSHHERVDVQTTSPGKRCDQLTAFRDASFSLVEVNVAACVTDP